MSLNFGKYVANFSVRQTIRHIRTVRTYGKSFHPNWMRLKNSQHHCHVSLSAYRYLSIERPRCFFAWIKIIVQYVRTYRMYYYFKGVFKGLQKIFCTVRYGTVQVIVLSFLSPSHQIFNFFLKRSSYVRSNHYWPRLTKHTYVPDRFLIERMWTKKINCLFVRTVC